MKILFLSSCADKKRGGAEETIWGMMQGLTAQGVSCVLLATADKPGLQRVEIDGITVWLAGIHNIYWPHDKKSPALPLRALWHTMDSFNPWMQQYIRQVVEYERPDVASMHIVTGWSVASWLTLLQLNIPIIQVLHDYYLICAKSTMYRMQRNCTGQCIDCRILRLPHRLLSQKLAAVFGVSRFILNKHQALGYFKNVPIQVVIPNNRSPQQLRVDTLPMESHSGLRFGFIGALTPVKGIEVLIKAFQVANLPNTELWIAGTGKQKYVDQLRNNVHDERVRFLGHVSPCDFYPQVDVVVVPSLWNEALGLVVVEALAFGKPVVGSRRGGIPEMVIDGENGLLFEPDMPGALVNMLSRLACEDNLLEELSSCAAASAQPFLNMDNWIRIYLDLYSKVINSNPRYN